MNGIPIYATIGVVNKVPQETQNLLWKLYFDRLKKIPADYLQIFELKVTLDEKGTQVQEVVHRQEQPPQQDIHLIPTNQAINQKIYVIEEEHYITMLLAEEY